MRSSLILSPSYKNSLRFLISHSLDVESQSVFLSYRTLIGLGLSSGWCSYRKTLFWKIGSVSAITKSCSDGFIP